MIHYKNTHFSSSPGFRSRMPILITRVIHTTNIVNATLFTFSDWFPNENGYRQDGAIEEA